MSKYLKTRAYQIVILKVRIGSKRVKIKKNWIYQHPKVLE
jgi:hypothetical protein